MMKRGRRCAAAIIIIRRCGLIVSQTKSKKKEEQEKTAAAATNFNGYIQRGVAGQPPIILHTRIHTRKDATKTHTHKRA